MSTRKAKQFKRDRDRAANKEARQSGFKDADDRETQRWEFSGTRYDNPPALDANGEGIRKPKGKGPPGGNSTVSSSVKERRDTGEKPPPKNPYLATEASPPSDELRYSIPTLANMYPAQEYGLLNTTAEGYLNLIDQCYAKMTKLDSRVLRTLPLEVFTHNMNQLYHLHMLKIARETGQSVTWTDVEADIDVEDLERVLNADDVQIPVELYDWLKGLGMFKDKTGYKYAPNVPRVAIPCKRRPGLTGGDFGQLNAVNHNVYETVISPAVTRATVQALLRNNVVNHRINYAPLPPGIAPQYGIPTGNLLGYRPILRPWHAETLEEYAPTQNSWAAASMCSRIGYNSFLWSKQNTVLRGFQDKMEIRTGMPPTDSGSLSLYGFIVYDFDEQDAVLRHTSGYLESSADLDPGSISGAMIKTYRRERVKDAPGYCYTRADARSLRGWDATINSSFTMQAPFAPSYGAADLFLNIPRFRREFSEGRYELIFDELIRMTVKK